MAGLTELYRWLAARSWIYELVQTLSGRREVDDRLAAQLALVVTPYAHVVDVGGGTGLARRLFPRNCTYTCLDNDVTKLRRFSKRHPNDVAQLADAAGMPLYSESIDVVLCKFVSHHIAAKGLPALISEAARVLKPAGRFVFVDAVWSPERRLARLLWKYDRGSFPRTEDDIKASITSHFDILAWKRLAVFHRYVICVAALKGNGPPLDYSPVLTRAPAQIT